jgi:hypothetical protein
VLDEAETGLSFSSIPKITPILPFYLLEKAEHDSSQLLR